MTTIDTSTAAGRRTGARPIGPLGCLAVLFILTVLGITSAILLGRHAGQRRVAGVLDRIASRGEPVTADALDQSYRVPADQPDATRHWLPAIRVVCSPEYEKARHELRVGFRDLPLPLPGEPWDDLEHYRQFVTGHRSILDAADQAVLAGGAARFKLDFDEGIDLLLPHAQAMREIVNLLELNAHLEARDGHAAAVAQAIRGMLAAARSLEYEPVLMSQLVRLGLVRTARRTFDRLMPHTRFPAEDLERLKSEFSQIDLRPGLARGLRGERVFGIIAFERRQSLGGEMFHVPVSYADYELYLEFMESMVAMPDESWRVARREAHRVGDEVGALRDRLNLVRCYRTAMLVPPPDFIDTAIAETAALRLTAGAIAIEQFRRRERRLPASWSELVPGDFAAVPADPFNGRPLGFVSETGGIRILSIGLENSAASSDEEAAQDLARTIRRRPGGEANPAQDTERPQP